MKAQKSMHNQITYPQELPYFSATYCHAQTYANIKKKHITIRNFEHHRNEMITHMPI